MGCCSTRPDPEVEKGKSAASAKTLRSEIDSEPNPLSVNRSRRKSQQPSRMSRHLTQRFSLQPASPKQLPKESPRESPPKLLIPTTPRLVSTKTSNVLSPKMLSHKTLSANLFKKSIRVDYTTIRKLHKGFYGDTLLANDKRTDIKKVIKEFKKLSIPVEYHEKFIMEIQKFQILDHPNVVKLQEVYETNESWLLVYEFFSGSNLLDKINTEGIGGSLACSIIEDIFSGLNYCHRNGVFHFGLSLEKIILDLKEGKVNCKIIGFSYPWELELLVKLREVSCYMAPEVLNNIYNEPASDVWGVGIMLYSIVQKKPPFRGKRVEDLLIEYKNELRFEESNWLFVSNELKDLLTKMLKYNYNERITIEEVLSHPWIKNSKSLLSVPAANGAISRFVDFNSKDKIARALFSFFKINLTNQIDQREFIQIYKNLDTDKDGQISKEELLNEAKKLEKNLQKKLNTIIKNTDLMEKGYLEFSEFLTACTDWNTDENIMKFEKAFKLCDKSGDGQLSIKELKENIKGIRSKEWAEFFGSVDYDQSGSISLEELKEFLFGKKSVISNQV